MATAADGERWWRRGRDCTPSGQEIMHHSRRIGASGSELVVVHFHQEKPDCAFLGQCI